MVTLQDSDEDSLNDTGSSAVTETASSVPLKYERRLQKMKDLAKQMPDSQLLLYIHVDIQFVHNNVHVYMHMYVYYMYTCMYMYTVYKYT